MVIKKYGKQSIIHHQITEYIPKDLAVEKEVSLINYYTKKGYYLLNIAKGGSLGSPVIKWTKEKIINEAIALEKAGASMLLLECVPGELAKTITQELKIPVIGIGAGVNTDGQIMVVHDLLGISCLDKPPKFVKNFMKTSTSISGAIKRYVKDVKNNKFPSKEHTFD